ncbi:hypothetical protein DFH29DRAFT_883750 [Suillus ampliporus]|nr:hypothetical protein DFH29DRAFT_883750 [Suillus ampliporus]
MTLVKSRATAHWMVVMWMMIALLTIHLPTLSGQIGTPKVEKSAESQMNFGDEQGPSNFLHIDFQYRKQIFAAAAVIILCTQFQIMQMTQQEPAKAEKANWNDVETDALLEYLICIDQKRFNEAAAHLHTKNLKNSWPHEDRGTLQEQMELIEIQKLGIHWDPVVGAKIQGTATEEAWSDYVSKSLNSGMKQFKNEWKYYTKMQQILTHVSAVYGAATIIQPHWQVLALPQRDILPLRIPAPVASNSLAAASPISSSGKRSHTDMVFNTAPPSLTSSTPMSEVPQAHSDMKKVKLSAQGGSNSGGGSNKIHVTSSKKAIKEAASTTVLMNLQGTINHLSDSITTSFTVTDESCISDERSHALQNMQQEEGLLTEDKLALMHAFMRSPIICATYLEIMQSKLRLRFLQSVIMEAKRSITL